MNEMKVLHVEIGPLVSARDRSIKVRRNCEDVPEPVANGAASLDTLSRLLSERNIALLKMIKDAKPESVAELARMSGRPKASLSLTLRRFQRFGVIEFKDVGGKRKVPVVVCDRLMLDLELDPKQVPEVQEG